MILALLILWLVPCINPEYHNDIEMVESGGMVSSLIAQSAQQLTDDWVGLVIEYLSDFELDEDEIQERISHLEVHFDNPMHIGTLTETDLSNLFLLSSFEIDDITHWIEKNRDKLTWTAFVSDQIVNPHLTTILRYFIIFEADEQPVHGLTTRRSRLNVQQLHGHLDYRIGAVSPRPVGYRSDGSYLGSQYQVRENAVLHFGNLSVRSSRNKVPGEMSMYPASLGQMTGSLIFRPDMNSTVKRIGITRVIAGDFRVRFGFGNIASGGTLRTGPRNISSMSTSGNIISQNGSSTAGNFMRGLSISGQTGNTELVLLASSRKLSSTQNDSIYYMPAWSNHARTQNELARQKNITWNTIGMGFRSTVLPTRFRMVFGGIFLLHYYNNEIKKRPGLSYRHDITGTNTSELSLYTVLSPEDWQLGLELSQANNSLAWIGQLGRRWNNIRAGIWYRYYDVGFKSVLGNAPSALSGSGNELGVGSWIRVRPARGQNLEIWTDRYRSLDLRFGTVAPIIGHEVGANYQLRLGRTLFDVSARQTNRLDTFVVYDDFYREMFVRYDVNRILLKMNLRTQLNSRVQSITRLEHNTYSTDTCCNYGIGVTQVLIISLNKTSVYAQYSTIQTDGFQNRVYVYEYDMIGAFRIPALSGIAQHGYIMIHQDIGKKITMRFKVARTIYADRTSTGSGQDMSPGRTRNRMDAQIRIRI